MTTEQRLANLEKQNLWMKRVGGLALAALACVVLIGQGEAKEPPDLEVRSLKITDKTGKTRISLGTNSGSGGVLTFFDKADVPRILIDVDGKTTAPSIMMTDDRRRVRAVMSVRTGRAYVTVANRDNAASITSPRKGDAFLSARIRNKAATHIDAGSLTLSHKNLPRLSLVTRTGEPSLTILDVNTKARAVLGVSRATNERTGAEATTAENTLTMYDAKGNLIWQGPK